MHDFVANLGRRNLAWPAHQCQYSQRPLQLGWSASRNTDIDVIIKYPDGELKSRRRIRFPRGGYVHDFFNSENYVVVVLHAVSSNPFPMLLGLEAFSETLQWQPKLGNLVMVIPKDTSSPVRHHEASPSWMWHSFNANEHGKELIIDFIGYEEPDHFLGPRAILDADRLDTGPIAT
jgi:all-trans-8'-apo-beta-carotenal 15,15'-oxygenase